VSLILTACGDGGVSVPGDTTYKVSFISTWSSTTHPDNFPASPHYSGLIGATHNKNIIFWQEGEPASPGIEHMAETGGKSLLIGEIETGITAGNADKLISLGGLSTSPDSFSFNLEVNESHPYLTIVTMLAPSPDWFAGVSSFKLREGGDWLGSKTIPLFAYDAGSDDGTDYTSANADSDPKQAISKISNSPFFVDGEIKQIGTLVIQRQ